MDTFTLWPDGPVICCGRAAQPVTTDSVLLADFVNLSGAKRLADFGAGSGLVSILLAFRSGPLRIDCVELSHDAAELCRENIARNALSERLSVLERDLRTLRESETGKYDAIVSNPPYFSAGAGASPMDEARRSAREDGSCTLAELSETAARLLGDGGRLTIVYPAQRLAEAVRITSAAGLEPKRLRLVQSDALSPPRLMLLECRRRGRPGLTIEPALLLHRTDGRDSAEARRIYHLDAPDKS